MAKKPQEPYYPRYWNETYKPNTPTKAEERARNAAEKKRASEFIKTNKKDIKATKNAAKKEALKKVMAKFKGGKGGRMGGLPGGGGTMPWEIK